MPNPIMPPNNTTMYGFTAPSDLNTTSTRTMTAHTVKNQRRASSESILGIVDPFHAQPVLRSDMPGRQHDPADEQQAVHP